MISTGGILPAIIVDTVIFSILFTLFCFFRKHRSARVSSSEYQPAFYETELTLLETLRGVYDYNKGEMLEHSNHEGWMYLTLYKAALKSLPGAAVLGMAILFPVYLAGNSKVIESIDKIGISHIIGDDLLMIAPVLCVPIFSAIFYLIVYAYYKESKDTLAYSVLLTQAENKRSYDHFTIEISGLPKNIPPAELTSKLHTFLNTELPGAFQSIYVVPDYTVTYQCQKKIDKYNTKLAHAKEYEQM